MIEEISFLDMVPTNSGVTTSRDLEKMQRADKRALVECYECKKKFCKYLPGVPNWLYREIIKGRVKYFCTWTCLSRNRKKRGKTNV